MLFSTRLDPYAVMALSGATLVNARNNPFPTNGLVPFRLAGDVVSRLAEFYKPKKSGYHIYGGVSLVASFETTGQAMDALPDAEHGLRINPGPGAYFDHETRASPPEIALIKQNGIGVGHVLTHWDLASRSIVNDTQPDHELYNGFVARQVAVVNRDIFVSTLGEGVNEHIAGGVPSAWANGTFGPGVFWPMDRDSSDRLSQHPGIREATSRVPPGAVAMYHSDAKGITLP